MPTETLIINTAAEKEAVEREGEIGIMAQRLMLESSTYETLTQDDDEALIKGAFVLAEKFYVARKVRQDAAKEIRHGR